MRYLLDTSALLAHYRQEAGWEAVQSLFETVEAELLIATVSLPEFGRRLRELGATETEVEETLANYELLFTELVSVDTAVAKAAFTIGCRTPQRLPLVGCTHCCGGASKRGNLGSPRRAYARHPLFIDRPTRSHSKSYITMLIILFSCRRGLSSIPRRII